MHGELLARVLERDNLQRALKQVRRNKGAPGVDGMTVDELPVHLKDHWLEIRASIVEGRWRPQPVRRVEIPKADGRKRVLGIPTVLDRFIQQAIAQVVQAQWEPHFHDHSYGFRPRRSAHQAVRELQAQVRDGRTWVVDLDLESFFDRVNHDRLMSRLGRHVDDVQLLRLIRRFLRAGACVDGHHEAATMGVLRPALIDIARSDLFLGDGLTMFSGERSPFGVRDKGTFHFGACCSRMWGLPPRRGEVVVMVAGMLPASARRTTEQRRPV